MKYQKNHGKIQLVVAWIHSDANHAFSIISQVIAETADHWHMFHILGSSANLNELKQELHVADNCSYHQVQLGFIRYQNQSRWLTHTEICNGVIDAIKRGDPTYTIGMTEPWELRP
ncbi:short-chain dehydrogenase [Virgibacillus halophilus]|uniref:Short-chain dehydrogenase n=1 Tax=Tigheibacillus halophilus TaxID=361280 RepID=A0ABU5CAT8_9BACI|nr:short-chain dehydrogenase [Virgibacillus halophilus]